MLDLEPSLDELRHGLPFKHDLVFLSREEALDLFARKLAEGTRMYGPATESDLDGAHLAQWRCHTPDGTPIRVRIALQEFRVTVSIAQDSS